MKLSFHPENKKDEFLEDNKLIFKKYKAIKKIGEGAFGKVYSVVRTKDMNAYAMKVEKKTNEDAFLKHEAFQLMNIEGFGFPKLITYGENKNYNILIETLLGKSLKKIFIDSNTECKIWEICLIGLQLIDRLEWIHFKNLIYRDIRPDNILIGLNDPNVIYLIDFGLTKKYRSSKTGKHILPKLNKEFYGNFKFASPYAVIGKESSRRDDMISLGYLLIFLLKKKLPWINEFPEMDKINDKIYREFANSKFTNGNGELYLNVPNELVTFVETAKHLKFEEKPNYSYFRSLLGKILLNNKLNPRDLVFSWIKYDRNKFKGIPKNNFNDKKDNFHNKLLSLFDNKRNEIKNDMDINTNIFDNFSKTASNFYTSNI